MKYEFYCASCDHQTGVERPMRESAHPVHCAKCQNLMQRIYSPPMVVTKGESIPYFHPALGQVVKSDDHARKLAKAKGWIEVGNEDPHKHTPKPKRHDYDFNDYFLDNGSI